jgi:hypothetical protein
MNLSSVDAQDLLVHDYLTAVAYAAADLPAVHRDELLTDLSEHIAVARSQCAPTEAGVRTILDRLGHPFAIVDAARGFVTGGAESWAGTPRAMPPPPAPVAAPDWSLGAFWNRSPAAVVVLAIVALGVLVLVLGFFATAAVTPPVR